MPALTALILIRGYVAGAQRWARTHAGNDVGAVTLEAVIIALGLIAVATLLVVAITTAVQRRVDQIN